MKKGELNRLEKGSILYVITHGRWQKGRGRRPSLSFWGLEIPSARLKLR